MACDNDADPKSSARTLQFDDVTLDLEDRVVVRSGQRHSLAGKYWNALMLLVERRPEVVGKDELRRVLGASEETLNKQISIIRATLGDTSIPWRFIVSERKEGYRFIALRTIAEQNHPLAQLMEELPRPQQTRWGPVDGKPAGICIIACDTGKFIPWDQLKPEIETKLLNQLGRVLSPAYTVSLADFRGRRDWIVSVGDSDGKEIANVWFGPDPDKEWAWDGLVRVGEAKKDYSHVVWQVF